MLHEAPGQERQHPSSQKGTDNGRAKLRDIDVALIRALHKHGFQQRMLCTMFSVSPYTVSMIVRNKIWTHLEEQGESKADAA
jgi:hypothetical protein